MSITMRQRVERIIARRLILDAIRAGYAISVYNGEEYVLEKSTNVKAILNQMFSVDDEHLVLYKDGKRAGWVYFVYGNDGWDVICDYTTNLEPIMAGVTELANKYQ